MENSVLDDIYCTEISILQVSQCVCEEQFCCTGLCQFSLRGGVGVGGMYRLLRVGHWSGKRGRGAGWGGGGEEKML